MPSKKPPPLVPNLTLAELQENREELLTERELVRQEDAQQQQDEDPLEYPEENLEALLADMFVFDPATNTYEQTSTLPLARRIESHRFAFLQIKTKIKQEQVAAQKKEKQLSKLWGGEFSALKTAKDSLEKLTEEWQSTRHNCRVFGRLLEKEEGILKDRLESERKLADGEKVRNKSLQAEFAALQAVKADLEGFLA